MFSIIVPFYNVGSEFNETLFSLINQSFKDFEVIVIDDGSDKPLRKRDMPRELKLTLVRTPNQGVSVARNTGAALAKGSYLVFLDAGDQLNSNFLDEVARLITRYNDCPFFATAFSIVNNANQASAKVNFDGQVSLLSYDEYLIKLLDGQYLFHICSTIIRRDLFFSAGGFNKAYTHGEDHELILKVFKKSKKMIFLNKSLFLYFTNNEQSATRALKIVHYYGHSMFLKALGRKRSNIETDYLVYTVVDNLIVNIKKGYYLQGFFNALKFLPFKYYPFMALRLFERVKKYAM